MSRLVLSLLLILTFPSFASALPIVAGFGNSITAEPSYLNLLHNYLEPDPVIDGNGVPAALTSGVLARLDDWIFGGGIWFNEPQTADVLILLAGTPDTYQAVGGWGNRNYDPLETVGNIEAMIDLVLTQTTIPLILVAPPPVMDPCGTAPYVVPTCAEINMRLANLADDPSPGQRDLAQLASDYGVQYLDLYAAFAADPRFAQHPGPNSLFLDDGLHPRLETGHDLIASLLAPMIVTALVPEPSTALLLASGLMALARRRCHSRKAA